MAEATGGRGTGGYDRPERIRAAVGGRAGGRRGREEVQGDGPLTRDEATGDGDRELLIALEGHVAGKSTREIAVNLYGAESVATEWTPDGVLRVQMRRLLCKARAQAERF